MFAFAGYAGDFYGTDINRVLSEISPYKDGKSYIFEGGCVLAQKQLSPRFDDGRTDYESVDGLHIVFSGRIYNKNDIAPNALQDAEAVLAGYKSLGKDVVKQLKGMFAFAIYDEAEQELFIARDGSGMRSVYYTLTKGGIAFATNTRGFEHFCGFKKELNENAVSPFLCFGSVPTSETLIKGVYRLEPGHYISFKDGKFSKECFFALEFRKDDKEIDEFIKDIHKTVEEAVNMHAIDNYGSFLSSGVDSSYIASVAKPKNTFTAGYSDSKYDESVYTKELADILGIENHVRIINPEEYLAEYKNVVYFMDEPLSNPSVASIYFGAGAASEKVDAIISGEGADELFGGYNSYKEELTHKKYMALPYFIRHLAYILTAWIPSKKFDFFARRGRKLRDYHIGLDRIFRDKDAKKLVNIKGGICTKDVVAEYYDRYESCTTMKQRQAIDYYFWLINDFVHCVARSADRWGIEARFPLLSKDVIDLAMGLPDEYKLKGGMTKYAFRMAAKNAIPNDAYGRKKLGFPVPLRDWIKRDDYYTAIKEKFNGEVAKKFFKVKRINKLLDDHKNGKANNYKPVWTVYTFIIWYEINFGG